MYVIVSATGDASCNFDDIDICGYEDLSPTGNWSQIHTPSESIILRRDDLLLMYMLWPCVRHCLSVITRCSVKRLNINHHTNKLHDSLENLVFSCLMEFKWGHPKLVLQIHVG